MVDCAATGTSSSVPQSKQVTLRRSPFGASTVLRAGLGVFSSEKFRRHCLQTVEMTVRGSGWECPPCGHTTVILSCMLAGIQHLPPGRRSSAGDQRGGGVPGAAGLGAEGVGATLFGLTSVRPTNVTPSSTTSFAARMSPNSSALVLISIFSLAEMLPVTLPRTTTDCALMFPFTTALSPSVRTPYELISPSSFPSNASSPANFRLPLISTSEASVFFDVLVVFMLSFYAYGAQSSSLTRAKPSKILSGYFRRCALNLSPQIGRASCRERV